MSQDLRPLAGRMKRLVLLVLAAALLASAANAAAPPVAVVEVPGPPLFNEDFHADAKRMSLAVIGASTTPVGPLSSMAVLYGGEHPRVRAWKFEGVMTNRVTRLQCGVASAVLAGFRDPPLGLSALAELATLKAGDHLMCWALRDTDRFHVLPKIWLEQFTDGKGIGVGGAEAEIYGKILTLANYTSTKAFHKKVRKDLTWSHLFNDAKTYRGEVVRIEGKLKRINRFPPPREATDEGVNDLYEAWIFSDALGANPYCVVFTEWPEKLPRSLLGEEIKGNYLVGADGYFLKKFRYKSKGGERESPLLIGHSISVLALPIPDVEADQMWWFRGTGKHWMGALILIIVALFASVLVAVLGLTWWFRRTDTRIRKRLLNNRSPEFILPAPDAVPVAPPVGPPARRNGGLPRAGMPPAPRITFPAGSGDRSGEPPSGEGGKRGSGDKPPEEGAGP